MGQPNRNRNARLRADARKTKSIAAALDYWRISFAGLRKGESPAGQGGASGATQDSTQQTKDSTAAAGRKGGRKC